MHSRTKGGRAHKARNALITAIGLQFAAVAPVMAQSAAGSKESAPSEAARRAAESPYRFILQNASIRERPKQAAPAAAPAPAPSPITETVTRRPAASEQPVASVASPAPQPVAAAAQASPTPAPAPVVAAAMPQARPAPVVAARKELVAVRQDPPELSPALLRERPTGNVTVAFDVNPDGSVTGVKVTHSSNTKLNRPSVNAITNWKFEPIDDQRQLEIELVYN